MLLKSCHKVRVGAVSVIGACAFIPAAGFAEDACTIVSDIPLYSERAEEAILLMQYEDIVVRATDGKISCEEDAENTRQICLVDGPGEILIESGRGLFVVQMTAQDEHELRIHSSGDLTCGLASDFR